MPLGCLTNNTQASMHPEHIDYSRIDTALRALIRSINASTWARTAGCCAGSACHPRGNFYLRIIVEGILGIRLLHKWLSSSQAMGMERCIKAPSVSSFAIPDAECIGSAFHEYAAGEWVGFDLRFLLGEGKPNRAQTAEGIKALELGWAAISGKKAP